MTDESDPTAPYGTWPSPITAEMVASDSKSFGHLALDGETVYWRELRPEEGGRGVVVRADGDATADVTPEDVDVRTLVHEYGGGDFAVRDGVVFYSRFDDQRVYRLVGDDGDPEPVTPEPATDRGLRYADFAVSPDGESLYCVRENHDSASEGTGSTSEEVDAANEGTAGKSEGTDGTSEEADGANERAGGTDEPTNELVRLAADGSDEPTVIASGHDFYAAPRLSPDGDRLAWLTWDHPRMPWDGTELHVATVTDDGTLADERVVLGGPAEAVFQPAWSPDGELHAVSDRTGWWNIYRVPLERDGTGTEPDGDSTPDGEAAPGSASARDGASAPGGDSVPGGDAESTGDPVPVVEREASYGAPQWLFGMSTYAFLDDGRIAAIVGEVDGQRVELRSGEKRTAVDLPFETFSPYLRSDGDSIVFPAGGPRTPTRIVRVTPGSEPETVRRSTTLEIDEAFLSTPAHVTYETRDGEAAHAYVYAPTNPDVEPPAQERPPLVVFAHGGPTGATSPELDLAVQYFTSRGFAVADVNYRGSTGYGRAFREALYGEWGIRDVEDTIDAARHLAEAGRTDPDRLAVRGGSAGGFVVLSALSFHDDVDAGASYYGVADLGRLAELTHKFESRYLDRLVGPYPEPADVYRERSPVEHADDIDAPVLLLQGEDDPVVPLSQAEAMAGALEASDVPHSLLVFEDEQHGFRRAASRARALESELAFYADVFGFEPADDLPALDLSTNGGG